MEVDPRREEAPYLDGTHFLRRKWIALLGFIFNNEMSSAQLPDVSLSQVTP